MGELGGILEPEWGSFNGRTGSSGGNRANYLRTAPDDDDGGGDDKGHAGTGPALFT